MTIYYKNYADISKNFFPPEKVKNNIKGHEYKKKYPLIKITDKVKKFKSKIDKENLL